MTTTTKLSPAKQLKALNLIAQWMGKKGYGTPITCGRCEPCELGAEDIYCENLKFGPAPTGPDAAANGLGPQLVPDWDWPSGGPTPTILLEGGPDDWAVRAAGDPDLVREFRKLGIFAEPYASYALCLYRDV